MNEENNNLEQNEYSQNNTNTGLYGTQEENVQTVSYESTADAVQPAVYEATNANVQAVSQENITQSVPKGYSVTAQPQMGAAYNFWQQQSGEYGNAYQQTQQAYTNMAMTPPLKEKKEYKLVKNVAKAAALGVVAAVGFCAVVFGANKLGIVSSDDTALKNGNYGKTIDATVVTSGGAISAQKDLTSVVQKCMPSIVSINSTVTSTYDSFYGSYDQERTGSGSGIILKISEDEILIVTNNHVIADAKKIVVGFDGMETEDDMVEATVKGTDSAKDLAVVLVKTKDVPEDILNHISAIEIGSSDDVRVGQMAIAIGNALGYGQSMTVGYISAKDRQVAVDENTTMTLLQTDAAINPGNSGGALLNANGELIGINSAKYSDTSVEGMGFAIPISDGISIINDLMEREVLTDEEKGYLGVQGTNITEDNRYPNMPVGAYISQVSEDGAAAEAGIMVGDIIVGVDDEEILTMEALAEKINSYRIGTEITINVKRYAEGEYKDKKIKVKLKGKETLNSLDTESSDEQSGSQDSSGEDQNRNENSQDGNNQTNPYGDEDLEQYYDYFFGN